MYKRGQFYLIAAFIIIIVFAGLLRVYTDVDSPDQLIDISILAKEIHYEGNQIITNRVIAGEDEDDIADEIKRLLDYYVSRYPTLEIMMVFGNVGNTFLVDENGIVKDDEDSVEVTIGDGEIREIDMESGRHNFFVIVISEREGERNIVVE